MIYSGHNLEKAIPKDVTKPERIWEIQPYGFLVSIELQFAEPIPNADVRSPWGLKAELFNLVTGEIKPIYNVVTLCKPM